MKIRFGFVTNSSSSNFLISKKRLTERQILAIKKHSKLGSALGIPCAEEPWDIEESKHYISGSTYLDNFNMGDFFDAIGVLSSSVMWDSHYSAKDAEEVFGEEIRGQKQGYRPEWGELLDRIEDGSL